MIDFKEIERLQYDELRKEIQKAQKAERPIVFLNTKELEAVKYILDYQDIVRDLYTTASPNEPIKKSSILYKLPDFSMSDDGITSDIKQPTLFVVFADETEEAQRSQETSALNEKLFRFIQLYKNVSLKRSKKWDAAPDEITKSMILVVTAETPHIPANIALYTEYIKLKPMGEDGLRRYISALIDTLDVSVPLKKVEEAGTNKTYYLLEDKDYLNILSKHFKGLSYIKIKQILQKIKYVYKRTYWPGYNGKDKEAFSKVIGLIQTEKEQLIATSSILHLIKKGGNKKATGLENLETYLNEKQKLIKDIDMYKHEWKLNAPKGVLVAGIPGSGKSLMAKHTAFLLNLPLIKMDMGDVQNKWVGSSERRMVESLELVNAMSPCVLWIDEIEKSFAGSSGNSNSDVTQRLFGKFLTWMQEKEDQDVCCFVFATANDISKLPPELFRSGRFDAKFYTFMPTADECGEIFDSLINKLCEDYNGAHQQDTIQKKLFDQREINHTLFINYLNGKFCIDEKYVTEKDFGGSDEISRKNKFFTGADIENVIKRAQELYILKRTDISGNFVYATEYFKKCLIDAIKEIKTYGETDLEKIASCYARMACNNFSPASKSNLMPFEGYDEYRKNGDVYILYQMQKEKEYIEEEYIKDIHHRYDRCLFCTIRNVLNRDREEILKTKKMYS